MYKLVLKYQQEHQQVVILNYVKFYNLPQITLS